MKKHLTQTPCCWLHGLGSLPSPLSPPPASLPAIALSLGWLARADVKVSSHSLWDTAEWVRVLCPHPWSLPLSLKWCLLPSHHPSFPPPSTTTLCWGTDCNPLCSLPETGLWWGIQDFPPIFSPHHNWRVLLFPSSSSSPFLHHHHLAVSNDTSLLLTRSHQVRLERVSDLPHLLLEPHLLTLHQIPQLRRSYGGRHGNPL